MARTVKKGTKKKDLKQMAFNRFMLVVAVFVIWIFGISVRLVHLQVNQHTWLKEQALDNRQDVKETRMLRGTIYDRNDRALAMSLRVKTLYADPTKIADIDATAKVLSKALKLNSNQLSEQLKQGAAAKKRFVPIAKKLDDDEVVKINRALDTPGVRKADLPNTHGIHWREEQKRSYPYQSLAAQVVGYSNASDDGKAGIEMSQDDLLHGAVINKIQERDRLGRVYDEEIVEREKPSDIVLTLDSAYQYVAEQALEAGVKASQAKSGIVIVMNPKNGEILALANYPTFDPNLITDAAAEHISNKAIQSNYSPGSVFKLVTYGSALEKGLFTPEDQIDSGNGTITIADHKFSDSHGIGRVSYTQAMAQSSNVCAIKTAMAVGKDDFHAMMKKMGFGAKTGVELPTETQGVVKPVAKWNGDSLASMSIGYEIDVSALQITTAFATIANNGVRVQPHLIKEVRKSDNSPKIVTQPEQTQVVTADTASSLKTMLRQVVLTGTGRRAQLNGYSVAGKTGTAWKFNQKLGKVDPSKYISSFIGMAPANDPEIVVAVIMDEPKAGGRDGGGAAAPIFREVAQRLLESMNITPDQPIKPAEVIAKEIPETPTENVKTKGEPTAKVKSDSNAKAKNGKDANKKIGPTDKKENKLKKDGKADSKPNSFNKMTARHFLMPQIFDPRHKVLRRFET